MERVTDATKEQVNDELRQALDLIKNNIGIANTVQNMQLHDAVQLIVNAARKVGLLENKGWS